MKESHDEAYDRLHGVDGHTQATPREEPCPVCGGSMRFCDHMDDPFAPVPEPNRTQVPASVDDSCRAEVADAVFRALHNEGDGGIWEHFDEANAREVAATLTPTVTAVAARAWDEGMRYAMPPERVLLFSDNPYR